MLETLVEPVGLDLENQLLVGADVAVAETMVIR